MLPHFWATLRQAFRAPSLLVLALLGVLSTAAGLSLSVLALGTPGATDEALLVETVQTTAVLVALWLLTLSQEAERRSGFTQASDQTLPGPQGRLLGRLLAILALAPAAALPAALYGSWTTSAQTFSWLYLYYTTIVPVAVTAAWACLIFVLSGTPLAALLGTLALWLAGHLPWGQPGWGGAGWGRTVGALLPARGAGASTSLAQVATAVGLVTLALAWLRPTPSRA